MNESPDEHSTRLLQQLQLAASDVRLPGDDGDEETLALRAAWRAFDEVLHSVEIEIDEAALIDRVLVDPSPASTSKGLSSYVSWPAISALASAAMLLLALAATWKLARQAEALPSRLAQGAASPTAPGEEVAEPDELAWDDPIDEQLAYAEQAIAQTRMSWSSAANLLEAVDVELQELKQDAEQGSL